MKRITAVCLSLLWVLTAAGCSGGTDTAGTQAPVEPEQSSVTAFGTVACAAALSMAFPFSVTVEAWYAREGERLDPGTPVLKIDMDALRRESERLVRERDALLAGRESCALRLEQARTDAAALEKAVDTMDVDELLHILVSLAEARTRAEKDPFEAALLSYLEAVDSLPAYETLLALTADRYDTRDNARPVLLALRDGLKRSLADCRAEALALEQTLYEIETEALTATEKTDIMESILAGESMSGIGSFSGEGVLTAAGTFLLTGAYPAGQNAPAGEALAVFGDLTAVEISLVIEEQLIGGIREGQDVQLSPLYDKSVVFLGTVTFVADRAVLVNGETVVPVTVTAEGETLDPGYNLAAKILLDN